MTMRTLLLLFILSFLPLVASADVVEIHGIYYNLESATKKAEVTFGNWSAWSYNDGDGRYFGAIVIPESVVFEEESYNVTSIGYEAFENCRDLTSVTIPNSVTSISGLAFYGCNNLTSVTLPNSVVSIEGGAFQGCSGLASVAISNSVTSIGEYAFYGCSGLSSVTIPNSVTSIGEYAFWGCI